MRRERSAWLVLTGGVIAILSTGACYELGSWLGAKAADGVVAGFKSQARVIPCSLANAPALRSEGAVSHKGYDGPARLRDDLGVVVASGRWVSGRFATWIDALALDGRPLTQGHRPDDADHTTTQSPLTSGDCGGDVVCVRLAMLPGSHIVTLIATALEGDKRRSTVAGRVEFTVEAGHLYSCHVCQPTARAPTFWVRDETSLTCVSTLCPGS
jgi:hypothetical protein